MIPGDIDLTENLDFRKVVKKEVPQLPDAWNKKNGKSKFKFSSSLSVSSTSSYTTNNLYISSSYNYIDTIDSATTDSIYFNIIDDDIIDISTISFSIDDHNLIRTTVSSNSSTNVYISYENEYIDTIASSSNYFKINTKVDEYDVFGNKKNYSVIDIPRIPWDKKRIYGCSSIPWNRHRYYDKSQYDLQEELPWDIEYETSRPNLSSPSKRAMNLISWLSDKRTSFIDNYLNSDKDADLSFLTNMNWIRVRDAIVD